MDAADRQILRGYIGIDSGSTTSKCVFIDENEQVTDTFYANNQGEPLKVVREGLLALAEKYPFFYGALGIHPNETKDLTEEDMDWLRKASGSEKIVAIGEIGLDYYWDEPDREIQKKWFVRQLSIAKDTGLPVVIHSRDAAKDTMDIIKAEHKGTTGGVIHCFSYGVDQAREYLDMGYFLGIGGVLTFKNAKKLKEVAEYAPMDRLVLETDCPYLTPVPYRGKRNSSLYLSYVAEALAELKGMERDEVIRVTAENARRLYRL